VDIIREPVSAVMPLKRAQISTDAGAIQRALVAWQWHFLDLRSALHTHQADCAACQRPNGGHARMPRCRKGKQLAKDYLKGQDAIERLRYALDTVPVRQQQLF
jgi:hypothetical protein